MIDDESTEIPWLNEMYLIFSQRVMEIFKLAVQELEKMKLQQQIFLLLLLISEIG